MEGGLQPRKSAALEKLAPFAIITILEAFDVKAHCTGIVILFCSVIYMFR